MNEDNQLWLGGEMTINLDAKKTVMHQEMCVIAEKCGYLITNVGQDHYIVELTDQVFLLTYGPDDHLWLVEKLGAMKKASDDDDTTLLVDLPMLTIKVNQGGDRKLYKKVSFLSSRAGIASLTTFWTQPDNHRRTPESHDQ